MAALTAQMQARRAERKRRRREAIAKENARISLMQRYGVPEQPYSRLGIDRSWHSVCRAVRYGVASKIGEDDG
jgi:hypothetical protein